MQNTKAQPTDADRELMVINTLFPQLTRSEQQLIFCSLNAAFIAARLRSPQQQNKIVDISHGRTRTKKIRVSQNSR